MLEMCVWGGGGVLEVGPWNGVLCLWWEDRGVCLGCAGGWGDRVG